MLQLKFNNLLTQAQYEALVTKDAGTLYFTTDTKRIYKGSGLYAVSSAIEDVQYDETTKLLTITYVNGTTGQLNLAAELDLKLDKKPNGEDNLIGENDKINTVYLPDSLLGQLVYCGTYDAAAGEVLKDLREPADREWKKNDYLIALVSGETLPDETTVENPIAVGDWVAFGGETWDVIPNTDAVSMVNGKTGAVVLDKEDVGLGNVDNTADVNKKVLSATKLTTARKINDEDFDGTQDITIPVPGVVNALTSTSTTDALSAVQGKVLNNKITELEEQLTWG